MSTRVFNNLGLRRNFIGLRVIIYLLFEFPVDLLSVVLLLFRITGASQSFGLGLWSSSRRWLVDGRAFGLYGFYGLFFLLFNNVAEDIIEYEVAIWLLSKNERLDELAVRCCFIGHLPNDLDYDILERLLRINVGNANFTIRNVELFDAFVNGLQVVGQR